MPSGKRETRSLALEDAGTSFGPRMPRTATACINEAAQKALERFDEVMRELALRRYQEFEAELGPKPLRADSERDRRWIDRVERINSELFDRGTEAFTWYALEELLRGPIA